MPHVTSIGLDVHARSVAAAAFNPFTGEVVHRDFGTDAAEIAEWALGFEEPRACYESGPTGFHMARELRALGLDCAVAAVSKMQRPAADARRKNDRRDAEFIARMLATHNIVEVPLPDAAVEAARDLDRALDDATAEYRRARQLLASIYFSPFSPTYFRQSRQRGCAGFANADAPLSASRLPPPSRPRRRWIRPSGGTTVPLS